MAPMRDQNAVIIDRSTLEREVERIVSAAEQAGLVVRVLGSIGVAMHCPDAADLLPSFSRTYADIDFASYRRQAKDVTRLMVSLGYLDNRDVFITSEGSRSIFDDPQRRIHVDVFYDRLDFCHVIPLTGRLEIDRPTIPLAELLLSKLQIVKINEKDVVDAILLLLDHRLGSGDTGIIDEDRIAELCAEDWGTWRTITQNLGKVGTLAAGYPQLGEPRRQVVATAVTALTERLEREPKSLAWRMRARVGDRRQWWTDVDEAV